MRYLAIALACLLVAGGADARPRWYKDWKVWVVAGAAAASTTYQVKSVHDCRARAGIEHCFGGYGSRKAMVGLVVGFQSGMFALSISARHNDLPEWWVPSTLATGFNLVDGGLNAAERARAHDEATSYRMKP